MKRRKRVVLLARAGVSCERTQAALAQAGAELAATLDPVDAGEQDVRAASPDAVMVVLDPAVEQALDKFDGLLGDPSLDIMFEDADVAARREGWEAARWARHLDAKLNGHDNVLPKAKDADETADVGFRAEMDALQLQVAALPDPPQARVQAPVAPGGAVVIVAGVGGPDAVRQLLGELPAGFPRPVVLWQRIENGQYDKLVRQMQRASAMQVALAQAGEPLRAGTVHVMTEGLDLHAGPAGLVFAASEATPAFAALPAGDSALLLLSGADKALVDRALALALAGGLALGQSAENCFDPAASAALVARGGEAASLAQLSRKLAARWPG